MPNIHQLGVKTPFSLFREKSLRPILPSGRYFLLYFWKKWSKFYSTFIKIFVNNHNQNHYPFFDLVLLFLYYNTVFLPIYILQLCNQYLLCNHLNKFSNLPTLNIHILTHFAVHFLLILYYHARKLTLYFHLLLLFH